MNKFNIDGSPPLRGFQPQLLSKFVFHQSSFRRCTRALVIPNFVLAAGCGFIVNLTIPYSILLYIKPSSKYYYAMLAVIAIIVAAIAFVIIVKLQIRK